MTKAAFSTLLELAGFVVICLAAALVYAPLGVAVVGVVLVVIGYALDRSHP